MYRTSDVVIVGAGIVGCAVACELARQGARVQLIEMREVGQGATQASAGMLAPYVEGRRRGPLHDLAVRSLGLYDALIARLAGEGHPVEYRRIGTLEVTTSPEDFDLLAQRCADLASSGLEARLLDAAAVHEVEPRLAADVTGGLLVPDHGYVIAADLARALFRTAVKYGARLHPNRALRIVPESGGMRVATPDETFTCRTVVLAAGSWTPRVETRDAPPIPVRPVRGQLIQLDWYGDPLPHIVWGPDCYLVPRVDGALLVGATQEEAGFDERTTAAGVRDLLTAVCDLVPHAWQAGFAAARVGFRPATPDDLPVIGASRRLPQLVYATGHFRNGILLAPLTAHLVSELVLEEREDPSLAILSPDRFGG